MDRPAPSTMRPLESDACASGNRLRTDARPTSPAAVRWRRARCRVTRGHGLLVARARQGDRRRLRGAGASHLRRHLHARLPADRRRGGRAGRGAGGLPAGLPGDQAVPRRRAVHHLAVPHHRELRGHPLGRRAPPPPRRASTTRPRWSTSGPRRDPRSRPTHGQLRDRVAGRARRSCRPSCGPSSCSATSTTCPTRPSPAELGISESAAKVRLHRARRKPPGAAVPAGRRGATSDERGAPSCV